MWYTLVEIRKSRVVSYEARIYAGKERRHTFSAMSEAGVRTWLAQQGIPFSRQHKLFSVQRG